MVWLSPSTMPRIMGILNVTPDSFSDGGRFNHVARALMQAQMMQQEGADFIDIGGESTHPGASPVSIQEELDRVLPVIDALRTHIQIPISIDTRHATVMKAAVQAGASMINDVYALRGADALETAAALKVPVCLMHMQGEPQTMQKAPHYQNVVQEIYDFLQERVAACLAAGISRDHIAIDPGFGFGKTYEHNLQLLHAFNQFTKLQLPVLAGLSRKAWIGVATGKPATERLAGSLAAAVLAAQQGVAILRVHDVGATKDALKVLCAVKEINT
jgi:dihydropteroate synthase